MEQELIGRSSSDLQPGGAIPDVPLGHMLTDMGATVVWGNTQAVELLGLDPAGKTLDDLVHEDDRPVIAQHLRFLRTSSRLRETPLRCRAQDGTVRHLLVLVGRAAADQDGPEQVSWLLRRDPKPRRQVDPAPSPFRRPNADPWERELHAALEAATCLFQADEAMVALIGELDALHPITALGRRGRVFEQAQTNVGEGPSVDAFQHDRTVAVTDMDTDRRWPDLLKTDVTGKIGAVLSAPVRVEGSPVGAITVLCAGPRGWDEEDEGCLESYASIVSRLLTTAAEAQRQEELAGQLQHALEHRVLVEQAKGLLMERRGVTAQGAYGLLRQTARSSGRRVSEVAAELMQAQNEPARRRAPSPAVRPPGAAMPQSSPAPQKPALGAPASQGPVPGAPGSREPASRTPVPGAPGSREAGSRTPVPGAPGSREAGSRTPVPGAPGSRRPVPGSQGQAVVANVGVPRRSRVPLDRFFRSMPVGLAFWDADLRYVQVNKTLAQINNRTVAEHVGRRPSEVLPQGAQVEMLLRGVLERGEPILELEVSQDVPSDDERRHHWQTSIYPVRDEDEGVLGVGAIVQDITDRVEHERRDDRAETRYEALLDTLSMDVWTAGPDGLLAGDLPAWRSITEQTTAEIAGSGWMNAIDPEDADRVRTAWDEAVRTGTPLMSEYRIRAPDGVSHRMLTNVHPVRDAGQVVEWVGVTSNVTVAHRSLLPDRETPDQG